MFSVGLFTIVSGTSWPFGPSSSFQTMPRVQRRRLFLTPYQITENISLRTVGHGLLLSQTRVLGKVVPPTSKSQRQKNYPWAFSLRVGGQEADAFCPSLSLSAVCHILKTIECIIYYLEKFYQREVSLRNITVSIQNVYHKKDFTQSGQAMKWISRFCILRRGKHSGCHSSTESILNDIL